MTRVLAIGSGPPSLTSATAAIIELVIRRGHETIIVHEPYGALTAATYDNYPTYSGLSLYEPPAPMKRIRALPSFTPLRFAPPTQPRAPVRQHKREAFVRCYQRHRESKSTEPRK